MKSLKTFNLIISFILISLLTSCLKTEDYKTLDDELKEIEEYLDTNNITAEPTWTGLYYIVNDTGTGIRPEYYDTVEIEYTATRIDGSLIASSDNEGKPAVFPLFNNSIIYGLSEAISYMKVGGKSTAIIPSYLAYGNVEYNEIEPYTTIIYNIELTKAEHNIVVEPYNVDTLTINTTNSGLKYYVVKADSGELVNPGDNVEVHYTGYLSNGRIFDSSVKRNKTFKLQIGFNNYIRGWEEGLILMKEGEKFRFIVPAELGYGKNGSYPVVPSDATLIFDIEIIDVK